MFSLYRYKTKDVALVYGKILRDCIQDESLCSVVLHCDTFYDLFNIIETSEADISADVFRTLEVYMFYFMLALFESIAYYFNPHP